MDIEIPLDKMTIQEKLRVLEKIWSDLQNSPEEVPSPQWHADVLQARENRVKEGTSEFLDWNEVKSFRERYSSGLGNT